MATITYTPEYYKYMGITPPAETKASSFWDLATQAMTKTVQPGSAPTAASLYQSGVPLSQIPSMLAQPAAVPAAVPVVAPKAGDSPTTGVAKTLATTTSVATTALSLISKALPVVAPIVAAGAVAYGIAEAVGVQFPWETGPGEGFIAPWTPKVKDENDKWVSALTRPDLFGGTTVAQQLGTIDGKQIVKTWKAGTWPFSMTSDGTIYTVTKSGIIKHWRPHKPIVLVRGHMNLKNSIRAQRLLDKQWRTVAKRVKQLKLA